MRKFFASKIDAGAVLLMLQAKRRAIILLWYDDCTFITFDALRTLSCQSRVSRLSC